MNMNAQITNQQLLQYAKTFWQWRWLWLTTTAVFAGMGGIYVLLLKTDTWVASQGLIVRDEANGAVMRLGRFQSQSEMQAAQETILEMARNPQVLADALQAVGPVHAWTNWKSGTGLPTAAEIEDLARNAIVVRAPRGAELGTTEVIYLDVKQKSRSAALELNKAVCDALEKRLKQVRQARADGVIAELTTARDAAARNLQGATGRLKQMEEQAGADLSDLRGLTDIYNGGSSNRQQLDTIKTELRSAELQLQELQTDLQLASESFENPDQLLLTPSQLVNKHPALRRLREGLAEANIATSQLQGRFTPHHPLVEASLEAEVKIREQLRRELGLAVETLEKDVEIAFARVDKLRQQQSQLESRLENLASVRAEYGNIVNEVRARGEILSDSERELSQAEASRESALTSSLVTRLDSPVVGGDPLGPGRATIVAGSAVGGLIFGLGVVFLLTPLDGSVNFGRRRFDYSGHIDRRASDEPTVTPQVAADNAATPTIQAPLPTSRRTRFSAATEAIHPATRPDRPLVPAVTPAVETFQSPQLFVTTSPSDPSLATARI